MDFGILRAVQSLKNHPYVQYVGLGFASLIKTEQTAGQDVGGRQRKTKLQLVRLSAAVCGIELCYAAETAFVSPILLKLGVPVSLMTMVWCLSPVLGFFLVPVMGSLSDRCPLSLGRRRPFIIVMSVGIVLGLALVPNGEAIGLWMGDNGTATLHHPKYFAPVNLSKSTAHATTRPAFAALHGSYDEARNIGSDSGFQKSKRPENVDFLNLTLSEWRGQARNTPMEDNSLEKFGNESRGREPVKAKATVYREGRERRSDTGEISGDKVQVEDGSKSPRQITPSSGRASGDSGDNSKSRSDTEDNFNSQSDSGDNSDTEGNSNSRSNTGENSVPAGNSKSQWAFQLSEDHFRGIILTILGVALLDFNCDACQSPCRAYLLDVSLPEDHSAGLTMFTVMAGLGGTVGYLMGGIDWNATSFGEAFGGHIRVVFTLVIAVFIVCVVSTVTSFKETPLRELGLTDEQLQKSKKKVGRSKYRKFTNEDSEEEEEAERTVDTAAPVRYGAVTHTHHSRSDGDGLPARIAPFRAPSEDDGDSFSSFKAIQARRRGSDDWLSDGGHYRQDAGYTSEDSHQKNDLHTIEGGDADNKPLENGLHNFINEPKTLGADRNLSLDLEAHPPIEISTDVTLKTYLKSIIHMPRCLWVLCLVNLFCWMSLVCYSLYFTDFVGQAVFLGDPQSPPGSEVHSRYDDGVRLGSFGMSLYSLSCSVYSLVIEKLVRRYRAKRVYVTGQLVFTVGMAIMAAARHKVAVVLLSPTAGIMYATLFTMPYLLVAHYHTSGMFSHGDQKQVRGLGTDVAIVSSMVFLAQFLLSVAMGTIIYAVSSTTTVMVASSVLSFFGAMTATQVTYLDL